MSNETDIDKTSERSPDPFAGYDDAYGEGFTDGRRSMATSVAKSLLGRLPVETLSEVTGLSPADIKALNTPEEAEKAASAHSDESATRTAEPGIDEGAAFSIIRENPISGTTLVEPSFVRLVRLVNDITQASLARLLGVHERTVCAWETAETPIHMKTATYSKLLKISDTRPGNPE